MQAFHPTLCYLDVSLMPYETSPMMMGRRVQYSFMRRCNPVKEECYLLKGICQYLKCNVKGFIFFSEYGEHD